MDHRAPPRRGHPGDTDSPSDEPRQDPGATLERLTHAESRRPARLPLSTTPMALPSPVAPRDPQRISLAPAIDYIGLAATATRAHFVASWPCLFLVGRHALDRPQGPQATQSSDFLGPAPRTLPMVAIPGDVREAPARLTVLAVRKVQPSFPSMITVGRTSNNDLIVPDVSVSRVHAFFRAMPGGIELADAGSRNGTFVGWRPLPSRGVGFLVTVGATVRFGKIEFNVYDAGGCWDVLRQDRK